MEEVDVNEPISIFNSEYMTAEFMKTMRDLASLSAVLKDLSTEKMYDSPMEIIRFLNIIQLLNEASLGINDPITNEEMLYYRYINTYGADEEPPKLQYIERVVAILQRNNWLVKQSRQIRLMDRGKRLMNGLIRMGNDALAYYLQDDIGRSLFQAQRDAEISAAYDDKGISGGNNIASMIYHVEQTIDQLQTRQLEFLADRNALPQLQKIHRLMSELEKTMNDRLAQFQTLEESLIMSDLVHRGTASISKGTALSLTILTKYIRFVSMQLTPMEHVISPEKVRNFILSMYEPPQRSDLPTAHDIFSFMEQNQYEEETLDGLWLPVKFAAPIGGEDIDGAIDYLENYEPKTEGEIIPLEEPDFEEVNTTQQSIEDMFEQAEWKLTKSQIDTSKIEAYLEEHGETEIEELMIESSSNEWHDAILSLLANAALTSNRKIERDPKEQTKDYEKEWEWIDDDDKRFTVRKKASDD